MRANNSQVNSNEDRKKEYERQQEKLKAMASAVDKVKPVSADLMIENLLKDSFKKPSNSPANIEHVDQSNSELPLWLLCESAMVPPQYKYLWSLVQLNNNLADTQRVSQLLLTSGLHIDVLGYIWNLANKAVPGQLTKQEFYIVLALVGLAQTGCTFNNLSVLKVLQAPTIPVLQVPPSKNIMPQSSGLPNAEPNSFQQFQSSVSQPTSSFNLNTSKKENENLNDFYVNEEVSLFHNNTFNVKKEKPHSILLDAGKGNKNIESLVLTDAKSYKSSNFPCIGSSPTAEMEDDFTEFQSVPVAASVVNMNSNNISYDKSDDFTEFQSANVEHSDPFETIVISQKKEIPKIPLPKTLTGKLTNLKSNILKISPESERKLKVLSKPESLSSLPESKISTNNKVSTSISVLGANQEIGSRLANHSLGAKLDRPKHHKHHKIKINPNKTAEQQGEEEVILGVKTSNIQTLMPKCCPKKPINCKTFILKETKIRNSELENSVSEHNNSEPVIAAENTRQIEIPMLGTFNETVLPTQTKPQVSGIDLISVQEDKYSALREIDLELNHEQPEVVRNSEDVDDFGDFLSADIPAPSLPTEAPAPLLFNSTLASVAPETNPTPLLSSTSVPDSVVLVTASHSVSPASPTVSTSSSLFVDLNSFQTATSVSSVGSPSKSEMKNEHLEEIEDWGDWNFNTEATPKPAEIVDISKPSVDKQYTDIFDSFNLLNLNGGQTDVKLPSESQNLDVFSGLEMNNSSGVSKKDDLINVMLSDTDKCENANGVLFPINSNQVNPNTSNDELWDFMASEVKAPAKEELSRHGSLQSLDLKMSVSEESEQETVWRQCLFSCQNIIQEGFDIFINISDKAVLNEVFAFEKTADYLNHLHIAYQISKRISRNSSELSSIQQNVERLWTRLEELCLVYNLKFKPDQDTGFEGTTQCSICLRFINNDIISQGNGNYHPSCANLYINFIGDTLPFSS